MLADMDHLTTRRIDLPTLKARLRERRDALGLDQEALADRAGLSPAYISRLERGAVPNPKVFDLEQVATALQMSVGDLLQSPDVPSSARRISECADILGQLDDAPPEITDTILQWLRESVNIALIGRQVRTN